jgi:hypothetical protein
MFFRMRALLMLVKSKMRSLPFSFSVSMLPPPSIRARLPVPVRSNAAMLLAHSGANTDAEAALWIQQDVGLIIL